MSGIGNLLLKALQVSIRLVCVIAQTRDQTRLDQVNVFFSECRMQRDVGKNVPRAIEVCAGRRHCQRRIIIAHAFAQDGAHARQFLAHPIAREAGAGFAGHVEHESFNAGVGRSDIARTPTDVKLDRDSLAALPALDQDF
jgi:hypothetical protein